MRRRLSAFPSLFSRGPGPRGAGLVGSLDTNILMSLLGLKGLMRILCYVAVLK